MNILIVNHSTQNCGVYQYGRRVGKILEKSENHLFEYFECESEECFFPKVGSFVPQIIIYNYLPGTMPWMNESIAEYLRNLGIKQMLIVHNNGYSRFFDYYLHQDPNFSGKDQNNFSLLRPLFNYKPKQKASNGPIKIGSFGFGFLSKRFEELCSVVNSQFLEENIDLRLHITYAHFGGDANESERIGNLCRQRITNPNISLTITSDFISDEEILEFLSDNDLNIFFYQAYSEYNGISSSIDYALSVERPVAISRSNMFAHILATTPSIVIDETPLKDILARGFKPLQETKDSWSHENFIKHVEEIIENV